MARRGAASAVIVITFYTMWMAEMQGGAYPILARPAIIGFLQSGKKTAAPLSK